MGYPTKIATCCHCGSKAALTLDRGRHELACASCGAPLHDLKMLPRRDKASDASERRRNAVSHQPGVRRFPAERRAEVAKKRKPKKVKRRKSWLRDMAEEVFELVEDILD
ncbi:hypothetical protein [Sulfitobacter sp. JB4-11]|uniref:hypothetical protein n=1 Tax=Sulfitobacter rhodophyticola TaxID=3238304 RepID=UPI003518F5D9